MSIRGHSSACNRTEVEWCGSTFNQGENPFQNIAVCTSPATLEMDSPGPCATLIFCVWPVAFAPPNKHLDIEKYDFEPNNTIHWAPI
jgi:hypothetical protein